LNWIHSCCTTEPAIRTLFNSYSTTPPSNHKGNTKNLELPKTFQNFVNSSRNSANHSCRNNIKLDTKQISMGIDTASYKKLVTPVSIQVPYSPERDNPRRSLAMQITHRLLKELTQAMVKQARKHRFFHVLSHSLQKPTAENHHRRTQNTKDFNFSSREKMGRSEKVQR
jgi:hypothetical protein